MTDYQCIECGVAKSFSNEEPELDGKTVLTTCAECAMRQCRSISNRIKLFRYKLGKLVMG